MPALIPVEWRRRGPATMKAPAVMRGRTRTTDQLPPLYENGKGEGPGDQPALPALRYKASPRNARPRPGTQTDLNAGKVDTFRHGDLYF